MFHNPFSCFVQQIQDQAFAPPDGLDPNGDWEAVYAEHILKTVQFDWRTAERTPLIVPAGTLRMRVRNQPDADGLLHLRAEYHRDLWPGDPALRIDLHCRPDPLRTPQRWSLTHRRTRRGPAHLPFGHGEEGSFRDHVVRTSLQADGRALGTASDVPRLTSNLSLLAGLPSRNGTERAWPAVAYYEDFVLLHRHAVPQHDAGGPYRDGEKLRVPVRRRLLLTGRSLQPTEFHLGARGWVQYLFCGPQRVFILTACGSLSDTTPGTP